MDSENERREYVRLPKDFRIELSKLSFPLNSQKVHNAKCINISAGGLLLETSRKFEAKEKVQVRIYTPGLNKFHPSYFKIFETSHGQNVLAIAEVARIEDKIPYEKYEIGLKFVDVYEDDWKALYNLLQSEIRDKG